MEMHYSLEELEDMEMQEVVVIEKQNMYVLIIENEKNPWHNYINEAYINKNLRCNGHF